MYAAYYDFIDNDPGTFAIKREVERLLHIEEKIQAVPRVLPVGPICLETRPITDALYGFAVQWKTQYAQVLHEEAKVSAILPSCTKLLRHLVIMTLSLLPTPL